MQQFCPRCGDEVDQLFGQRGLCKSCYTETNDLVELPDEISFDQCTHCMDYRLDNTWKEYESDQKMVLDLLKPYEKEDIDMGASFRREGDKIIVNVMMEDEKNRELIQQTQQVILRPEKTQCPKCAKFHGGHFEAVLQLRGGITEAGFGELMDAATRYTNQDRNDFIADTEKKDDGYNIYCSTDSMARSLLSELEDHHDLEVTESRELVGEQDGERQYRYVISARIL